MALFLSAIFVEKKFSRLKAMLHGAIFLATCNAILLLRDVKFPNTSLHYARVNSWSNHPPPGNLPDRQFTGVGNLPFIISCTCTGAGYCYSRLGPRGFDKWLPRIPPANFKAAKPSFRHASGRADRVIVFCALVVKVA